MYRTLGRIVKNASLSFQTVGQTVNQAVNQSRFNSNISSILVKKLYNPSNWSITGSSTAGVGTSMYLLEPDIMVDCGTRIVRESDNEPIIPSNLLITHHHGDHNRHAGYYAEKDVKIIDPVTDHYHALGGRVYELDNQIRAETIELDHTIKCVGYGIINKSGEHEMREVAMLGDTRIDPLHEMPEILEYPVIVIECTNYDLDPNKVRMYRQYGHISWPEIKDVIINNKDNYFHLIHPSSKLDSKDRQIIQEELIDSENILNAQIWPY